MHFTIFINDSCIKALQHDTIVSIICLMIEDNKSNLSCLSSDAYEIEFHLDCAGTGS